MNNDEMYMIRISNGDILNYVGYAVDVELDTISVLSGWNWIGFILDQIPPGERKSGMPLSVEIPAPVKITTRED